jgi:hypothetical protein
MLADEKRLCDADGGRLWGVGLWGPIMVVDPGSRAFVASERDGLGVATAQDGVFVGTLPPDQNIANTAFRWGGVEWTQVMWPLPEAADDRGVLLSHELFHRVQAGLGITGGHPENQHLDTVDGRYLLQLEWRALAEANRATDAGVRTREVADALAFRMARRHLFPRAAAEERDQEVVEGLAEYTGITVALSSPADRAAYTLRNIDRMTTVPSFVRSFAYASGPAYGLLLDLTGGAWRDRTRRGDDLGDLLAGALGVAPLAGGDDAVKERAARYDGERLRASEQARHDRLQARAAEYRRKFVDGPTLSIPLSHMKIQFDPRTLEPLGEAGTVYPTLRVVDDWGILTVTGGALLAPDWTRVTVVAPKDGASTGDGWDLQLNEGWTVAAGARPGTYVVTRAGR